jgi:2-polyprenyl-3-methyl-5-hydroxy-6-metoxy-1,4-benzoquinol methylase
VYAALQEIQAWGAIYDEAYASQNAANADPSLNFSGYDNSYTPHIPHQIPVVREWVETTCMRIAALNPKRALEMGCGQGMIMLRCAEMAEELYVACDLSQYSVNYCSDILENDPRFKLPHVRSPSH